MLGLRGGGAEAAGSRFGGALRLRAGGRAGFADSFSS